MSSEIETQLLSDVAAKKLEKDITNIHETNS